MFVEKGRGGKLDARNIKTWTDRGCTKWSWKIHGEHLFLKNGRNTLITLDNKLSTLSKMKDVLAAEKFYSDLSTESVETSIAETFASSSNST